MDPKQSRPAPSHPLKWFPEFLRLGGRRLRPQARLLGLSLGVGVIAGLGAIVFYTLTQIVFHWSLIAVGGYHPLPPLGERPFSWLPDGLQWVWLGKLWPWLLLLIPTVGGVVSGFLVYTLAPEAEGHGTDAAIAAYHYHQGNIRPRVPLVKIVASAITLGTGGSGGREGPIAQIGAGFGSFLGRLLRLRPAERRILMAAGMGAGVAAIFRAPLAGALFAAEVLYSSPDFESEVIMPAALASITAYCTFGSVFGWQPLFDLSKLNEPFTFDDPWQLIPYLLLALFMVVLAMIYTRSFYGLTHLFHRLPMRPHFKPALGGFLTGLLGLILFAVFRREEVLAVLSTGYGILQKSMTIPADQEASLALAALLLAIAVGKIVTTGLTIGSGGSGGVFGPSMVIGGCGGGALGIFFRWLGGPVFVPHPASYIIVGMAGFFAAAAKTPFSTLVIVSEMTGNYNLLLPTLWVCALAFLLSDEQSLYSSQVSTRSRSPAHQGDYVREVLAGLSVGQFLQPPHPPLSPAGGEGRVRGLDVPGVHPGDSLAVVVDRLKTTALPALPVTDSKGSFLGMVSLEEVHLAAHSPNLLPLVVVADLMRTDVMPLRVNDPLDRALELFVESNLLVLPVVDGTADRHVIGLVNRADISNCYLSHVQGTGPARDEAGTTSA